MKKFFVLAILAAAPVAFAQQGTQSGSAEPQNAPATGSSAASSHHARHHHKRSKNTHHRAQHHKTSKQHTQPQ